MLVLGSKFLESNVLNSSNTVICFGTNAMQCMHAQLCLTLCDFVDCSPPGSPVHGLFQAGILEWVAISSSRGSSLLRDQSHNSCVSCTAGGFFTIEPPGMPILETCAVNSKRSCQLLFY